MDYMLLVMLLKDLVILPSQEIKIELKDEISKKIIKISSKKYNSRVLVASPNNVEVSPSIEDLPKVGVVAYIKNKLELSNGNLRVTLKGEKRVKINEYNAFSDDIISALVVDVSLIKLDKDNADILRKRLRTNLNEYIDASPSISNSILKVVMDNNDLNFLTDVITSFLPLSVDKKLNYMEEANCEKRAISLIKDIKMEIKYLKLEEKIDAKLQVRLSEEQEEYYLKEKLKEIETTLGIKTENSDYSKYYEKLASLNLNKKTYEKIKGEIKKLERTNLSSPENATLQSYLDWILNLPWNISSKEVLNSKKVLATLNKSHYGLNKIKERIVEYINVKNINPELSSPIICLVGPPGVGKTTITKSIAESLNREYYKISVGGLNDGTELVGARRTYLGALPGKIIQGLKKCNTNNPVILIDEVDKMVKDFKGDPASTLLDILDSTQNKTFVDNYIEEPFDLSNVLFILTANDINMIPATLTDRLEIIELSSYTVFEKLDIVKKYILPKIYKDYNMTKKLEIKDSTLLYLINNYTKEAGVRNLTRVMNTLVTKIISGKNSLTVREKDLSKYLEAEFLKEDALTELMPGVVNALAYTNYGGVSFLVESAIYPGKEELIITGSIGKVLEESIKVCLSYLKSQNYIQEDTLKNKTLHIHLLDGATKKEGPSCGVAISVAILSNVLNKKISPDLSFTGELSLKGNILKIGGLKEKLIAAYNKGIKKVYIPVSNKNDLKEIPKKILDKLEIKLVTNFKEIYQDLF